MVAYWSPSVNPFLFQWYEPHFRVNKTTSSSQWRHIAYGPTCHLVDCLSRYRKLRNPHANIMFTYTAPEHNLNFSRWISVPLPDHILLSETFMHFAVALLTNCIARLSLSWHQTTTLGATVESSLNVISSNRNIFPNMNSCLILMP